MNNLIPLYQQRFNLQNSTFVRIAHDDAMIAIVYKIIQPSGTHLILKISPRSQDYFREVYFLKHFAGVLPVPKIIQTADPEEDVPGAILMECFPGELLQEADFTDAVAYELGSLLARIHLNSVHAYGDLTQPQSMTSDVRLYFASKFNEGFKECSNHLSQELLDRSRAYFDAHINLLSSVDGPCMIHRDFRAGNIMMHQGKIQGIIDWASGRASFAQEDFAPLYDGGWPAIPARKRSFLAGYASIRPVPDYAAMIPLLRLGRAFATIGFTVKTETWMDANARIYQHYRKYLETLLG